MPCGHKNIVECGKKLYELICNEKCGKQLECGHECKGSCGKCLQGTLHIKCTSKCDRTLPCGHRCEQKCSAECICEKKCENICPHGYCDDICCDICIDCEEKCKIGCIHERCKKKCGELCTRKPCNKRCPKKMKCNHQCNGLCGERCPDICRICDPKNKCFIEDALYLTELDEDELIYKTNCDHIISVKGLDDWIKNNRKIQMYSCPVCTKSLILEPRYQNDIKKMFADVQKVKKICLKRNLEQNGVEYFLKSQKIANRILEQYGEEDESIKNKKYLKYLNEKINIFELFPDYIKYEANNLKWKIPTIYNLVKIEFKTTKNNNIKKNTTYNLLTLAEKFMGIEYYAFHIKSNNSEKIENQFLRNYNIIKNYFSKLDGQLTHYFFKDLKKKVDNMLYYSLLKLPRKYSFLSSLYENKIVEKNEKILKEIEKSNFTSDIDLKDLYNNSMIELEAINITRTLGITWYKCPNGHPYIVGECGRPMEESVCPECNSKIGGLDHIPASQNIELNFNNRENALHGVLLNQDENAYNNMNVHHEQEMDPEVEEAIRNNPEMSEYN